MTEPRRSGVLLVPLFLLLVMVTAALPLAQPTVRPPADGGEAAPSTARTMAADASSRQTGIAQTDRPTISDATNGSTTNNDAEKQTTKQTTAADVTVKPTTSVSPDELTTVHTTGRPSQSTAGQLTTSETAEMNRVSSSTDVTGTNPTTTADKLESALPQTDDARTKPITDEPKTVLPTSDGPSATQTTAGEPRTVSAKTDVVSQETTDGGPTSQGASSEAAPAPTSMADVATSDALASDSPTADTPTSDRPTSDRPTSNRSTSDTPTSDTPTSDRPTSDKPTSDRSTSDTPTSDTPTSDTPTSDKPTSDTPTAAGTTGALLEIEVEESTETGTLNIDLRQPDDAAPPPATPSSTTQPPAPPHHEEDESGGVLPDDDVQQNEVLDEDTYRAKHKGPWLIGSRLAGQDDGEASLASSSTSSLSAPSLGLYRNYDVDSQERERELEERAREQNHPADLEDTNVHEVNHYVPEEEQDDEQQQLQQQKSVARWYLLLLTGNATTVRLRQKDFAKYLKLNLAARLSVEYNDLRVNRVEFKPLLMVNVTIFSRPKDNEEAPLHMLADTNATLLELSGEEYHVLRFITIPSEHQEALAALASGGIQAEYTGANTLPPRHVDVGVAVYFAIAAGLVSILLAVFLVGLCRYLRTMAAEVAWPWRRYKPIVWRLPLQHRLCADHIAHCVPMQPAVWTTADGAADVPVHKIPAPELPQLPRRLVLEPRPAAAMPPILCADPAPSTADTLLQAQPAPVQANAANAANACSARPNSKLSLFGEQQVVVAPVRSARQPADRAGDRTAGRNRLQPQGRHPLDVRIGRRAPSSASTVLGLDNPNYMMQ